MYEKYSGYLQRAFQPGESPYFKMYGAGCNGIPIEACIQRLTLIGVPYRSKDIKAWENGYAKYLGERRDNIVGFDPLIQKDREISVGEKMLSMSLSDFDYYPPNYQGTNNKWFPCTAANQSMIKYWGYKENYVPPLTDYATAYQMSECGYVAQNLYHQPMIVIDIDGVGHGETDQRTIDFGNRYRNLTETWEDQRKPGSFHLHFYTDKCIPIGHYLYAKIDLMGNKTNAAVYAKTKVPNGIPKAILTDDIWRELTDYLKMRLAERNQNINN